MGGYMLTAFTTGKMVEYTASRDFSLNFEDRTIKSVKIKSGSTVSYDGVTAELMQGAIKITGRCPSLKAAISKLNWLIPKNGESVNMFAEPAAAPVRSKGDFDPKTGGSFDTFLNKGGLNGEKKQRMAVQHQEDLVVKTIPEKKAPPKTESEVVPEQAVVRENLTVGSSTTVPRASTHSAKVIQSENAGAQSSIPLKGTGRKVVATEDRPKKTFTVDITTPGVPEDSTMADVRRATTVINVDSASSQNSKVIKQIGKKAASVTEVEGITMRKTVSKETPITAKVGSGDREINVKATITPGESVSDLQGETTVVKSILSDEEKLAASRKAAEAKKAARMSTPTSKAMAKTAPEKPVPPEKPAQEASVITPNFSPLTGGSFDTFMAAEGLNGKEASTAAEVPQDLPEETAERPDYMAMLPDNWGDMHWAPKRGVHHSSDRQGFPQFHPHR